MPAKRAKSKKTKLETIREDVLGAFKAKATKELTADGEKALADMFDITVKKFKKSAAQKAPEVDLWTVGDGKFRTFILKEAQKIAVAASSAAGSGKIDAAILNKAGLKTMLATNASCDVAIAKGKLILDGSELQGPVCSAFLQQQAGS